MNVATRPPVAFIVEGAGEAVTFPGLAARICGTKGLHCPTVNAEGYGGVLANLHEHLDDVARFRPLTVVITVDLRDVLRDKRFPNCATLVSSIATDAEKWLESRRGVEHFEPLPEDIIVVAQIQKFETWWLADPEALSRQQYFEIDLAECQWTNVDVEVPNPTAWLIERCKGPVSLKSRDLAIDVIRAARPVKMRQLSPSFDKFHRETESAYQRWVTQVQAA